MPVSFDANLESKTSIALKWGIFGADKGPKFETDIDIAKDAEFGKRMARGVGKPIISIGNDLLRLLGIASLELHDGGNDAVFELQAMIARMHLTGQQWALVKSNVPLQPQLLSTWPAVPPFNRTYSPKLQRVQAAPAISSEQEFPSLGSASNTGSKGGEKDDSSKSQKWPATRK